MARTRACCATATTRRTISSCGPGPSRTPLRSTAASTSSVMSTSGPDRCRSRTRRSGSRAAARSRPGSGARRWTMSTPICPISASRTPRDMHGFWEEMDRLGKERNPYRAGFLQSVGVAESREEAMRLYREPAEYFYGRCLRVDPRWAMPPGYITEATQRAGIIGQIGRAASLQARQAARSTTRMEDIVERGYVIIGSPDEVVEQLTELATDLNVGHLMLLMQFGSMGKELAAYNTKLFAEQVLPKLRGLFSEWEDKWWPQPMAPAERAEVPAFQASLAAE